MHARAKSTAKIDLFSNRLFSTCSGTARLGAAVGEHAFLAIVKASVTSQPCLGGFSACALSLPQGVDRLYYFNYTALRHDCDTHTEAVT